MNKRLIPTVALTLLLIAVSQSLNAQYWSPNGSNISNSNSGNVGIGTSNPAQRLTIAGGIRVDDGATFAGNIATNPDAQGWLHFGAVGSGEGVGSTRTASTNQYGLDFFTDYIPRFSITNGGNVGIGTQAPELKLTVFGGIRVDAGNGYNGGISYGNTNYPWLSFGAGNSGEGIASNRSASPGPGLEFYTKYSMRMFISNIGNVLIGKTTQTNTGYILDVNGNVRANQVTVNSSGADFVFDKSYHLPALDSTADYISKNHHLPGIASAGEMQKNGINVGDNQTLLLQKVEELTLYMIDLKKENEELKTRLVKLENVRK